MKLIIPLILSETQGVPPALLYHFCFDRVFVKIPSSAYRWGGY